MKCPNCRLENPPGAMLCDCGYNFATGRKPAEVANPAPIYSWLANLRGCAVAVAVLGFIAITIYRDATVTRENYDAIHRGMTKAEVRAVLGNPTGVTESSFDGTRMEQWDYVASSFSRSKVILIDFENGEVTDKTWGGEHY